MALPHPSTQLAHSPFLSFDGRDLIVRLVYRDEHDESIVEVIFERALAFSQRAEPLTPASYYEDSYDKVAIRDAGPWLRENPVRSWAPSEQPGDVSHHLLTLDSWGSLDVISESVRIV